MHVRPLPPAAQAVLQVNLCRAYIGAQGRQHGEGNPPRYSKLRTRQPHMQHAKPPPHPEHFSFLAFFFIKDAVPGVLSSDLFDRPMPNCTYTRPGGKKLTVRCGSQGIARTSPVHCCRPGATACSEPAARDCRSRQPGSRCIATPAQRTTPGPRCNDLKGTLCRGIGMLGESAGCSRVA